MKLKKISKSWYFLIIVILIYIALFIINQQAFFKSSSFFINTLKTIIPIFLLIFILMALMNYFITSKTITKHFQEKSKISTWFFAIIAGVLSLGPIYMWYPLLAQAKNKGISYGLISCFLYNRAIKIPLLPMIIIYFGIKYVFILGITMILMSVIQGIIINKLMEVKK